MSSASPSPFPMSRASSRVGSSIATTPPSSKHEDEVDVEDEEILSPDNQQYKTLNAPEEEPSTDHASRQKFAQLDALLQKSTKYTELLGEQMKEAAQRQAAERAAQVDVDEDEAEELSPSKRGKRAKRRSNANTSRKRPRIDDEAVAAAVEARLNTMPQPAEIVGTQLREYQLQGVAWMAGLFQNGVNGILADEMGLGKTLQTIAFLAHLREQKVAKPFLVVCPLSVLHNWVDEFEKFAPSIKVCMYHGSKAERMKLRQTRFGPLHRQRREHHEYLRSKKAMERRAAAEARSQALEEAGREEKPEADEAEEQEANEAEEAAATEKVKNMPVIITTYEMIIKDTKFLANLDWGYIIVDEGHRLKNFEGKLITEIKKYESMNRLILTGTPLHNNLAELWSLLNFILPDIFSDLDSFQEWFNLSSTAFTADGEPQPIISASQSSQIVTKLHAILKPFLLRRIKADVETSIPPKKEYVLYAPLSEIQRGAYEAIMNGAIRGYLISKQSERRGDKLGLGNKGIDIHAPRKTRKNASKGKKVDYVIDEDDDEYFDKLEAGEIVDYREERKTESKTASQMGNEYLRKLSLKKINSLKLQNTVMQLRKVCSHPYLFDWPIDEKTLNPIADEQLVNASGKMMVLERLLDELFKRGHKVLLFSQFTTMLDIIEEWAEDFKGFRLCRIDGSTAPLERRAQMNKFQSGGTSPNAPQLFLLSTRAGGLGINLTAADTVVFFDNDWNPQMDIQAQDRAHRIGQTKPVLVFRLVSAHTIESRVLQKATAKRRLEAMVIAKGKFRAPGQRSNAKGEEAGEMLGDLLRLEGEKIDVVPSTDAGKAQVISDQDLNVLLDRSVEVFQDRLSGWAKEAEGKKVVDGATAGTAFEVFEAVPDEGNDGLAKMFGEDIQ